MTPLAPSLSCVSAEGSPLHSQEPIVATMALLLTAGLCVRIWGRKEPSLPRNEKLHYGVGGCRGPPTGVSAVFTQLRWPVARKEPLERGAAPRAPMSRQWWPAPPRPASPSAASSASSDMSSRSSQADSLREAQQRLHWLAEQRVALLNFRTAPKWCKLLLEQSLLSVGDDWRRAQDAVAELGLPLRERKRAYGPTLGAHVLRHVKKARTSGAATATLVNLSVPLLPGGADAGNRSLFVLRQAPTEGPKGPGLASELWTVLTAASLPCPPQTRRRTSSEGCCHPWRRRCRQHPWERRRPKEQ
eukprot:scaffold7530_cov239-Pinguiococcus_pyrenoidosus.AAC.4